MTAEQRQAIEDAIAECEARARAATEEMLALKQTARMLRQRAHLLRGLLPDAALPGSAPEGTAER